MERPHDGLDRFLLQQSGRPGWLIGGCPHDLCAGAHLGEDAHFVIEGDEYDSAFFDKRSKFIHYQPKILLVNNLEFDHADIFRDFEAIHTSFLHLLKVVPASGKIILNGDDPQVLSLREAAWSPCFLVGTQAHNDLIIAHYQDAPQGAQFDLIWQGTYWTTVQLNLHGLYNARNVAMAALARPLHNQCLRRSNSTCNAWCLSRRCASSGCALQLSKYGCD